MRYLKKAIMPVTAVIVLFGMLSSFMLLYPLRNNQDLHIQDLSGNRDILKNVSISGTLADSIQKTDFVFRNGGLEKSFSIRKNDSDKYYYYHDPEQYRQPVNVNLDFAMPNDADKRVTESTVNGHKETKIISNKAVISYYIYPNDRNVLTDVIVKAVDYGIEVSYGEFGNKITNRGHYLQHVGIGIDVSDLKPIQRFGDKVYLYTLTGKSCSGFGGVYDISVVDNLKSKPKNLAPVDLKDGAVQIVGMEASNNWFVFITVENNHVVLKPFNIKLNHFTDDIIITPIPNGDRFRYIFYENRGESSRNTASFQDPDTLCLELKSSKDYDFLSRFYVISLNQNKKLLSYIEKEPISDSMVDYQRETTMKYVDDMLFVLRSYQQMEENPSPNKTNPIHENRARISVYQNNASLYQGEILSAARDDFFFQASDLSDNFGIEMRDYFFLKLN